MIPRYRDDEPDEYRVRVYPARSWFRHGWRVQVDSLKDWEASGDCPMLTGSSFWATDRWLPTREMAVKYGVGIAEEIHRDNAYGTPLVIHIGPELYIDERK